MNNLKPASVFNWFAKINQIPRPSKHEERMIAFLAEFGKSRGLDTHVDETGNVIIRKPATAGYEDRETVVLQSHMDMVCDKLVDREIDFLNDPIETYVDGEWMRARGTTLGADDGMGDAMELALLDADDIPHGPIECVFTRDEETGLTGANGMKPDFMSGRYLINLDSEDEGQIFVSCAGGINTEASFRFTKEEVPGMFFIRIAVKGLNGGHSGDDIDKKRANAIKLLARFVYNEMQKTTVRIAAFNSGKLHNAIPRDGYVILAVPTQDKEMVRADWNVFATEVADEFHVTDTNMEFMMESADVQPVMDAATSDRLIRALQALHNGILAICQDKEMNGLVETSSNLASVETGDGVVNVVTSQRSSVMSNRENMSNTVKAAFELAGAEVTQSDGYPAWKMNPNSELTRITVETYRKLFGKDPIVKGIHAGLECGLFSEKYPGMDMVSFGPTLRDVHTPAERLHIPSVEMVWNHLLEILKNIPVRQ